MSDKLEQAQELVYKAWEADPEERAKLAAEALNISADCADAYVILAEDTARNLKEKLYLYEAGFKAGERALGPWPFIRDCGSFWGVTTTRPYMRARFGFARCLEQIGRRPEALRHYVELMRLNRSDNQGVRYYLANGLLAEGEFLTFEKYFSKREKDRRAYWMYALALWHFQRYGTAPQSTRVLKKALSQNRYVPRYLLRVKKPREYEGTFYQVGTKEEALVYSEIGWDAWHNTRGALAWLRRHAQHLLPFPKATRN